MARRKSPSSTRHIQASDHLLTSGEVLAFLRVARSTFDTWRSLGTAPECIKLPNGQLRVSRDRLNAWLKAHIEGATAAAISAWQDGQPLLIVGEVLAELGVARSTFDGWRALGSAPECIKLPNGQLRVSRSALDTWLKARVDAAEVA